MNCLAAGFLISGALCLGVQDVDDGDPFESRHAWGRNYLINASLSWDGTRLFYVRVSLVEHNEGTDLDSVLIDTESGEAVIRNDLGLDVRWAPEGHAMLKTRETNQGNTEVSIALPEDDEAYVVGKLEGTIGSLKLSEDMHWALFTRFVAAPGLPVPDHMPAPPSGGGWVEGPRLEDREIFREFDSELLLARGENRLFLTNLDTGKEMAVGPEDVSFGSSLEHPGKNMGFDVSSRGDQVVFDGRRDPVARSDRYRSSIFRFERVAGRTVRLTPPGYWHSPSLLANGDVLYLGHDAVHSFYTPSGIHLYEAKTGKTLALVEDVPDSPELIGITGEAAYFSVVKEGSRNLYELDLSSHEWRAVTTGQHDLQTVAIHPEGEVAYGVREKPDHPGELIEVALDTGAIKELTSHNKQFVDTVRIPGYRRVDYESTDGVQVAGWYLVPAEWDGQHPLPTIVHLHGGINTHKMHYQVDYQIYAASGFAVFLPNYRGSISHGGDYANAVAKGFLRPQIRDDILSGVDHLVGSGVADPQRLFITGISGGGVISAWIIGQTDRFKAAAPAMMVANEISWAGTSETGTTLTVHERPFWEDPSPYLAQSPIMQVGKINTPALVIYGEHDVTTPPSEAFQFFRALKRRGVPTLLMEIPNEGHDSQSLSIIVRRAHYIMDWFNRFGAGVTPR